MSSIFTFPNRVVFGEGARRSLAIELNRLGVRRPLIVTDPGVSRAGLVEEATGGPVGMLVFEGVHPNPTEADVVAGLSVFMESGCDGLVAVGGGSAIDAAKAIRLLSTHAGTFGDFDYTACGSEAITSNLPPMVAMPTTAGTGSEVGRGTLVQLAGNGRKTIALSGHLLPSVAICDPELTYALPSVLTAATGMDAFTHAVESYLSTTFHPMCDGIAAEALRYLAKGLEASVRDGSDAEARRAQMMGALLAGVSFHKGLGVVHSLSHALGAEGRVHHGTLNAILLPHALRFNREAAESRMAELATRMGMGRNGDAASHLIMLAELILTRLPLPRKLSELGGLERSRIPHYARLAMLDHCHRTNPRPCLEENMAELLEAAW